ncbi:MAG: hypothetical protein WC443_08090 [Desulfobaccales bacterium]
MAKRLLIIALAGLFLGCSATAGRRYNTAAIENIEVGKTTPSEVVAMLGPPLSERKLSNGTNIYNYTYAETPFLAVGNYVDNLQVVFFNGVVIDKWQWLARY